MCLYLFRRRVEPANLLATLAFLFLLVEPLALWQPSFLLSFSGVFGILLWQKPLQTFVRPLPTPLRTPLQLIGISCAAIIGTLPATLFFFHLFAPAGIVINVVAIPMVSLIALPFGLAGLGIGFFSHVCGAWLLQLSAWVLQLVIELAVFISDLEWFSPRSLFLTIPELTGILIACLALLIGMQKRRVLLLLLPALGLYLYQPSTVIEPEMVMFSVGQGESILLRLEGKTILVDGGGLRSENFDVGERLLAPALGRLGVKKIDAMLLTHNHPDHSKGLSYIIENFPVVEFWSSGDVNALPAGLRELLTERDVAINRFEGNWGQPLVAGLDEISLFVAQLEEITENDRSLCVYIPSAAGGVLLTGDLEAAGVDALIKNPPPGPVGLLKVPHHGSSKSDPARLLEALDPQAIVVSAGFGNAYRFPSRQLLSEVEAQRVNFWRTDRDGTIHLRAVGQLWQAVD